jgi:DNA-binding NarL/FixJ family response regulator
MGGKDYDMGRNDKHFQRKTTMTMTNQSILTLLVSGSGLLQDGLLALMTTIPPISAVLVAEDFESALRLVENHQPALVILELSSLQVQDDLHEIKAQCTHVHLIVLVEDIAQQKEIEASGADTVLIKGFSAQELIAIVENIIDYREDTPPVQAKAEGGTNTD